MKCQHGHNMNCALLPFFVLKVIVGMPSTYPRTYSCCSWDFWILQTVGRQHTLGPILVVHTDLLQSGVG